MDGRAWNSGYQVTVDGWQSSQWVKSIREVTRIFNDHGIQVSHSKVYNIQVKRDDREAGRSGASIRVLYGRYPSKRNLSRLGSEASVTNNIL